jgi:hypothetical protein
MPEQIGGRTYYSPEEAEALGLTPTPEHLAWAHASFDPALRAQIQARADDVHAGTDAEGSTLRDGAWYDAEGNLLYTQGPDGWYDPSGVLVYDLLGRRPNSPR